jgi:chromosome segregation ATPase
MMDKNDAGMIAKIYEEMLEIRKDITGVKDDITNMKGDIADMKGDIQDLKSDMSEVKSDIVKLYVKVENDIEPKLGTLYEGYQQVYSIARENREKLDEIAKQVHNQEVEIKVIQGGRK